MSEGSSCCRGGYGVGFDDIQVSEGSSCCRGGDGVGFDDIQVRMQLVHGG